MDEKRFGAVRIDTLNPMRVVTYRRISPSPELDCNAYIKDWLASRNVKDPVRHFGFDVDVPPDQADQGLRGYEVWASVPPEVHPYRNVKVHQFEGGLYAVMRIENPFEDPFEWIPAAWEKLSQWVNENDQYQPAGHQWLEEIVTENSIDHLLLYHPVQEKRGGGARG